MNLVFCAFDVCFIRVFCMYTKFLFGNYDHESSVWFENQNLNPLIDYFSADILKYSSILQISSFYCQNESDQNI